MLAPCILPLLPVIVGGSVDGSTSIKRALTVTLSLALSVIAFTLLLKASTLFVAVPESVWQWISGVIIIFFGLILLFPSVWERFPLLARLNQRSNVVLGSGYQKKSFWGDVLVGGALGPVFSTCSPTYFVILASVLPVSFALGLTYLVSYTLGLSVALLAIAFVGNRLVTHLGVAADPHGWFKRGLGILFLLIGIAIIGGYDKKLETGILNSGFFDVTKLEQKLLRENLGSQLPKSGGYQLAPELAGIDGYINTSGKPITIGEFKGKSVVLVDFWTYSCINCQRTLPYVTAWYEKYKDQGLVVIGVHTPEFAFEHVEANVEDATKRFNIHYPVVLDNEYGTWNAFGNQFWPRKYLVDIDGYIVYDHAGEGNYEETEHVIQAALKERNDRLATKVEVPTDVTTPTNTITMGDIGSPETYFGASRNEYLGNGKEGKAGEQNFLEPMSIQKNMLYLIGQWNITPEYAQTSASVGSGSVGSDRIDYLYHAKGVYLVAGAKDQPLTIEVLRDGKPLGASFMGADVFVKDGKSYVTVSENRLYKIIEDTESGEHLLEFVISSPGLQVYTFTFG